MKKSKAHKAKSSAGFTFSLIPTYVGAGIVHEEGEIPNIGKTERGFTLLEFLIVTAVAVIILALVFSTFTTFRNNQLLTSYSESITATLQEARLNTTASKGDKQYGVHFESDKYVLFEGTTYNSSDTNNREVAIRNSIEISPISLNGGGGDVLFERLLGKTSQYGTVVLTLKSNASTTRTINIDRTGIISFTQ